MTVVFIFILTNLPYLVDEFIRQQIVTNQQCNTPVCHALKVTTLASHLTQSSYSPLQAFLGISTVMNSAINPFIFLLFNSESKLATTLINHCCPLTARAQQR